MFTMLSFRSSLPLTLLSILGSFYAGSLLTLANGLSNPRDVERYIQAAYFTNWGIYGANFQPTDIDPSQLTHILYAFADVSSDTGQVFLTDSYADEQKHFPGDSWDQPGNNLYGCLKQLYLLKLSHRHLKVLLSVGGWTYSQEGHFSFLSDSSLRANFVASAVTLVKDYGFDGIDIDIEYLESEEEGQAFADLLASLRDAFDDLAFSNGDATPYELTVAVSAGPEHYAYYPISQMDPVITYWNLMAYDYAGSWLSFADNQANLYGGSRTGVSTDAAVEHFLASGATPRKFVIGIPLYGRAFENTDGIGQPYDGVGPGTLEPGVYSYKYLPLPGAEVLEDLKDVASYSYDPVKRELVSYDVPDIVRIKAEYVVARSLAGCVFWELSTDKTGSESLVWNAADTFGHLDQTQNHIHYPHSKWDNVRNNMDGASSPPGSMGTPTPASTHTSSPSPSPSPSPSRGSGSCAGTSSWNASAIYTAGQETTYDGQLWMAKWWTENDEPGCSDVWKDEGECD